MKLTPSQQRLLEALSQEGAVLLGTNYRQAFPSESRLGQYVARPQTVFALERRGLLVYNGRGDYVITEQGRKAA